MSLRPAISLALLAAFGGLAPFVLSTLSSAAEPLNARAITTALEPVAAVERARPEPVAAMERARPEPRGRPPANRLVVRRTVRLRARPGGHVVVHAAARTEFGGRRVLSVVRRRGPWLGVLATELPNGRLAWIHRRAAGLDERRTALSLHADLSARRLVLRRGGRVLERLVVAIGAPGSETPTGRFAVTDKLAGGRFGPYYGCCILALTGKQPNTPPGWTGGNRLAIHGTDSPGTIGAAASAGCLRAADDGLRVLMRRVPLGTPVFIRA